MCMRLCDCANQINLFNHEFISFFLILTSNPSFFTFRLWSVCFSLALPIIMFCIFYSRIRSISAHTGRHRPNLTTKHICSRIILMKIDGLLLARHNYICSLPFFSLLSPCSPYSSRMYLVVFRCSFGLLFANAFIQINFCFLHME